MAKASAEGLLTSTGSESLKPSSHPTNHRGPSNNATDQMKYRPAETIYEAAPQLKGVSLTGSK